MEAIKLIERLPSRIVEALKNSEQSPKYHPEGSVYNHTVQVVERAIKTNDPDIIVSAIFHDLGKLDTETRDEKNGEITIHHYGHEIVSINYFREYGELYKDLVVDQNKIEDIILNHMRAQLFSSFKMTNPHKRENFKNMKNFESIMAFSKCDKGGL